MFGPQQQGIHLLILGAPDLQHRQGFVAHGNGADVDACPLWIHDLLQHVAAAPRALIVNADDRVPVSHLNAGPDHAAHLLLHLRVTSLYRVEVQLRHILSLHHAGCGASAHAYPVGRAPEFDDPHFLFRRVLLRVPGIDLADSATEHYGFDPLPALSIPKTQAE